MLTQEGFAVLKPLTPSRIAFAVFLLATFNLIKFSALHPDKLAEFNQRFKNMTDGEEAFLSLEKLMRYVDDLVQCGFLEYGPFVPGWKKKRIPTVRVHPRLLITPFDAKELLRRKKEREQRGSLVKAD